MSRVARRRIRPRRSIIFLVTSMVVVGLAFLVVLVFSSPDSFQAPQASMLKTAPERARLFERNFVSELTRIRKPQAEWGVRIREDDLNAWLWVRLPQWMSHVGADESVDLGSVQAILESNRILVTSTGWVLAFEPDVRSEGARHSSATRQLAGAAARTRRSGPSIQPWARFRPDAGRTRRGVFLRRILCPVASSWEMVARWNCLKPGLVMPSWCLSSRP